MNVVFDDLVFESVRQAIAPVGVEWLADPDDSPVFRFKYEIPGDSLTAVFRPERVVLSKLGYFFLKYVINMLELFEIRLSERGIATDEIQAARGRMVGKYPECLPMEVALTTC